MQCLARTGNHERQRIWLSRRCRVGQEGGRKRLECRCMWQVCDQNEGKEGCPVRRHQEVRREELLEEGLGNQARISVPDTHSPWAPRMEMQCWKKMVLEAECGMNWRGIDKGRGDQLCGCWNDWSAKWGAHGLMGDWQLNPCMFALTGTLRQTLQNDGFDVEPQSDISTFIQFNLIILSPGM